MRVLAVLTVTHIGTFSKTDRSGWDDEDWAIAFGERAAVLEHDEGMTRLEAELLAHQQIEAQRQTQGTEPGGTGHTEEGRTT
jgi:hypothetical protein